MIPIINDHSQPQLTNTEKAISMLQTEIENLHNWNKGLQRQIAGICLGKGISPKQFSENTRSAEIDKFLEDAFKAEEEMITAENKEKDENLKKIDEFKAPV